jgi:hypothetical protein
MASNVHEADIHLYYCRGCKQYPYEINNIDEKHPWNAGPFKYINNSLVERCFYSSRKNELGDSIPRFPGEKETGVWECHSDNLISKVVKDNLAQARHVCPSAQRRSSQTKFWSDLTKSKGDKKN